MISLFEYDVLARRIWMSKRLVVVGGGAGGPSSAAEAKRRDKSLDVTMIERGDFVSYAA